MANKFPIDVSAQDNFSKVFDRLDKLTRSVTRPIAEFGKVSKSAFDATGIPALGDAISKIGGVAIRVGKDLEELVGPVGLLTGVGSVAGIAALGIQWGKLGLSLSNSAASAGVATNSMARMRSAAELAGASGDAVASSLQGLSEITNDARFGRNNQALALLQRLRVSLAETSDGTIDTRKEFLDLLDAIAQQPSPATQNMVARTFGIDPSLLTPDVRRGGAAAWLAHEQAAGARGDTLSQQQVEQRSVLGKSINSLKSSASGVWNQIGDDTIPFIKSITDRLDHWLSGNKDVAARMTEVGGAAGLAAGGVGGASALAGGAGLAASGVAAALPAAAAIGIGAGAAWLGSKSGDALGKQIDQQVKDLGGFVDPAMGMFIAMPASSAPPASRSSPAASRANNPLNLRPGGNFARYGSMDEGLEAATENILAYRNKYGIDTIGGIVSRWAPPAENDTGSYIADVAHRTGFGPGEHLDLDNPSTLSALVAAMGRHEQGHDVASPDAIANAVAEALARQPIGINLNVSMAGAPEGMRATATDDRGKQMPVRVELRMPLAGTP